MAPAVLGLPSTNNGSESSTHRLCFLIPFRDRFEELTEFVTYMHEFLAEQDDVKEYEFIVINQVRTCSKMKREFNIKKKNSFHIASRSVLD